MVHTCQPYCAHWWRAGGLASKHTLVGPPSTKSSARCPMVRGDGVLVRVRHGQPLHCGCLPNIWQLLNPPPTFHVMHRYPDHWPRHQLAGSVMQPICMLLRVLGSAGGGPASRHREHPLGGKVWRTAAHRHVGSAVDMGMEQCGGARAHAQQTGMMCRVCVCTSIQYTSYSSPPHTHRACLLQGKPRPASWYQQCSRRSQARGIFSVICSTSSWYIYSTPPHAPPPYTNSQRGLLGNPRPQHPRFFPIRQEPAGADARPGRWAASLHGTV